MSKRILIPLMLYLIFLGCKESTLNLKVRFDQIEGLKEGDLVFFEHNHIGKVEGVFYSDDGYYMVDLEIKHDFANAATERCKFFIIAEPHNKKKKAIEMVQTRKGGSPLQDGATVDGSTKSSAFLNLVMRDDFEKGLQDLKKEFDQFSKDLGNVPESKEFKKLEKDLKDLAEDMKRSGKAAREKIDKELLPWLKQEIEKLRERLRKFGREEEVRPIEIQMEEIMRI